MIELMNIVCLFCDKTYTNKKILKRHYINNTCKSELLKNQLTLHNYIKNIIKQIKMHSLKEYPVIIPYTCLFCNVVYSRKYNFERHLSNNSCKSIMNNDQYKTYNYVLSIIHQTKKFENEIVKNKIKLKEQKQNIEEELEKKRLQKINRTEYLKKWKEQNKEKIISYRVKYKEKIKNYITEHNHH